MYILSGIYEGRESPVAKFSTKELANKYVTSVTLQGYPNGCLRFRRDSCLGSYYNYSIDVETVVDLPVDPDPPTTPPQIEHILEITDSTGYKTKINYGRYVDEMEREKAGFKNLGYTVTCVTKEV